MYGLVRALERDAKAFLESERRVMYLAVCSSTCCLSVYCATR
jgi:hypothetical protein